MRTIKNTMIYSLIMCWSLSACLNATPKKKPFVLQQSDTLTDNERQLLWGTPSSVDSSDFLSVALNALNKSDYRRSIAIMQKNLPLDTAKFEDYYYYTIDKDFLPSPIQNYVVFRINDYLENLWEDKLSTEVSYYSRLKNDRSLDSLQIREDIALGIRKDTGSCKESIDDVVQQLRQYPKSKRLKYILASEYLHNGQLNNALSLFDKLIEEDYYTLASLRKILHYFNFNNNILSKNYLNILKNRFPSECSLFYIKPSLDSISEEKLLALCKPCIQSGFQDDSIFAKIYQAKFYLRRGDYKKVDSMYEYFSTHKDGIYFTEPNQKLERGMYFDLRLRSLFLEKKYTEFQRFAFNVKNISENSLIDIETDEQFENYTKRLFNDYISKDDSKFSLFLKENFSR